MPPYIDSIANLFSANVMRKQAGPNPTGKGGSSQVNQTMASTRGKSRGKSVGKSLGSTIKSTNQSVRSTRR